EAQLRQIGDGLRIGVPEDVVIGLQNRSLAPHLLAAVPRALRGLLLAARPVTGLLRSDVPVRQPDGDIDADVEAAAFRERDRPARARCVEESRLLAERDSRFTRHLAVLEPQPERASVLCGL